MCVSETVAELFGMPFKDWDRICRELSTPEDSDAEDELNLPMMQRRTPRVAELVSQLIGGATGSAPPKGMNSIDAINPFKARAAIANARATSAAVTIQRAVRARRATTPTTSPTAEQSAAAIVQRAWRSTRGSAAKTEVSSLAL